MALSNPFAQGPGSLPSPIPNATAAPGAGLVNSSIGSSPISAPPAIRTPASLPAGPTPGPSPQPMGSPMGSPQPQQAEQNPFDMGGEATEVHPDSGKGFVDQPIQASYLGSRFRVNTDSSVEMYDKTMKKFVPLDDKNKGYFAEMYNGARDLPGMALIAGSTLAGGKIIGSLMSSFGSTAQQVSAAAGRTGGAMGGAMATGTGAVNDAQNWVADKYLGLIFGKDMAAVMKAASGNMSEKPNPNNATSAMLMGAIQGGAELLGGAGAAQEARLAMREHQAEMAKFKQALEQKAMERVAARNDVAWRSAGVTLTPGQQAAGIPGLEPVVARDQLLRDQIAQKAATAAVGSSAATEQGLIASHGLEQQSKVAGAVNDVISASQTKMASRPEGVLPLSKTSGIGMYTNSALDEQMGAHRSQLSIDRSDVREMNRQLPAERQVKIDGADFKTYFDQAVLDAFGGMNPGLKAAGQIDQKQMMKIFSDSGMDYRDLRMIHRLYNIASGAFADVESENALNQTMGHARKQIFGQSSTGPTATHVQDPLVVPETHPSYSVEANGGLPPSGGGQMTFGTLQTSPGSPGGPLGSQTRTDMGSQSSLPGKSYGRLPLSESEIPNPNRTGNTRSRMISFDELSGLNDRMQQVAKRTMNTSKDPAVIEAVTRFSSQITQLEDDVIAKTFGNSGQGPRATAVIERKKIYAGFIDSVNQLSGIARNNPSDLAKNIWARPVDEMSNLMRALPEYHKAEVQSYVAQNLFKEAYLESNGNLRWVSENFNKALDSSDPRKLEVLFGSDQADRLRGIAKTVSYIDDASSFRSRMAEKNLPMQLLSMASKGGKAVKLANILSDVLLRDSTAKDVLSYDFMSQLGKIENAYKPPTAGEYAKARAMSAAKYLPAAGEIVRGATGMVPRSFPKQSEEKNPFD